MAHTPLPRCRSRLCETFWERCSGKLAGGLSATGAPRLITLLQHEFFWWRKFFCLSFDLRPFPEISEKRHGMNLIASRLCGHANLFASRVVVWCAMLHVHLIAVHKWGLAVMSGCKTETFSSFLRHALENQKIQNVNIGRFCCTNRFHAHMVTFHGGVFPLSVLLNSNRWSTVMKLDNMIWMS